MDGTQNSHTIMDIIYTVVANLIQQKVSGAFVLLIVALCLFPYLVSYIKRRLNQRDSSNG